MFSPVRVTVPLSFAGEFFGYTVSFHDTVFVTSQAYIRPIQSDLSSVYGVSRFSKIFVSLCFGL